LFQGIDTVGAMPRRDVLVRPAQVETTMPLKLSLTREETGRSTCSTT